ncbi:HemK2/MTQ2 family protein methyltransferase [Lentzea kentuckyensis]|uniref:HemK2/MTQ2 family protein methyltransferase n=1 Tax=Lentzea kentuckyensis TaxID=360086 RepID=UPI0013020F66|nr:HemK2/MTQ2 family protein methyltransferase [Lentzea kentuckyensis]
MAALHRDHSVHIEGKNVLDIGSGSGVYAVAMLAAGAGQVTALDINPAAAEVTAENARRNGLDSGRLTCVTGDLADFQPDRRFDLVVANPPHLPYDDRYSGHGGLETALVGGADGRLLYDLLVSRADDLLGEDGVMIVAHSSLADIARTIDDMSARGFVHQTIEVCEMDIPLVRYAEHRETVLARLAVLRELGCASFDGKRFWVNVLAFSRSHRSGTR